MKELLGFITGAGVAVGSVWLRWFYCVDTFKDNPWSLASVFTGTIAIFGVAIGIGIVTSALGIKPPQQQK